MTMTGCESLRSDFFSALDGASSRRWRDHLADCVDCREEFEEARRFETTLRAKRTESLAHFAPRRELEERLRAAELQAIGRPEPDRLARDSDRSTVAAHPFRPEFRGARSALAASAILGILLWLVFSLTPAPIPALMDPASMDEISALRYSPVRSVASTEFHLKVDVLRPGFYYVIQVDDVELSWLFPLEADGGLDWLGHSGAEFAASESSPLTVYLPALDYGSFVSDAGDPAFAVVFRSDRELSGSDRSALMRAVRTATAEPSLLRERIARRYPGATLVPLGR